ncbi:50S ribosomal protein L19e [Candidatus Woesearchaeota archaeon]|nr:50S ribosomal protein L19e [Candidatus Woesearchaeota archaeon]
MMLQKRLGADILKCSPQRVWLDPTKLDEIKGAITKFDVRRLIAQGIIIKEALYGGSKVRSRERQAQRSRGRRRGIGSRKGTAGARTPAKETWMARIRTQRDLIKRLRDHGTITPQTFHQVYRKAKGGFFRSTRHIKVYLEEQNLFLKK